MKENNRCSTLFHLLVPGGKRQTEIDRPVSFANFCNSNFQSRNREPLLPPPSAVISNARASEYKARPSLRHHPRTDATANAPVSWSVPTFTNPVLRARSEMPYGYARGTSGEGKSCPFTLTGFFAGSHCWPPLS